MIDQIINLAKVSFEIGNTLNEIELRPYNMSEEKN